MDGKNHLRILELPERDINAERIKLALSALNDPKQEYDALNGIFEGLIQFYETLDAPEAENIVYDLNKILYYSQVFYDEWIDNDIV